jgi:hypothetical protein
MSFRDLLGVAVPFPPAGCESTGNRWFPGRTPLGQWPDDRYLVVYDGAGHGLDGNIAELAMTTAVFDFLFTKLAP